MVGESALHEDLLNVPNHLAQALGEGLFSALGDEPEAPTKVAVEDRHAVKRDNHEFFRVGLPCCRILRGNAYPHVFGDLASKGAEVP